MTLDAFADILVDTVGSLHGAAGLVDFGILAHTVDVAQLAFIVERLCGLSQKVLDKRKLDR